MTQKTPDVLNQFLKEFGNPPGQAIEDSRENLLDRFTSSNVRLSEVTETVEISMRVAPMRTFRFAWAAGIVLAAVLVSMVVWGPRFSVAVKTASDRSMSRLSSQQAGETLPVTIPPDAFEIASVKLLSPSSEAAKAAKSGEETALALSGCSGNGGSARIDPGRVTFPAVSVLTLVIAAYGRDCTLVEGGPAWARSGEYYEINALLPQGAPSYTVRDLIKGDAPVLQRMLQNLLANRFQLVLRREVREMPVYALTVVTPGRIKVSPDETLQSSIPFGPAELARGRSQQSMGASRDLVSFVAQFSGHAISMSDLTTYLRPLAGRIIVDKTGVNDVFDADLKFVPEVTPRVPNLPMPQIPNPPAPIPPVPTLAPPSLKIELQEKLGLKLESTRMPIEVLIIQSVERPSEN